MADLTIVRNKAWETRRRKYGPRGHAGSYSRNSNIAPIAHPDTWGMLNLIIRLHAEGVLSEGQVARATGYDRVEIRRLHDEFINGSSAFLTVDACAARGLTPYAVYGGKVYSFKDNSGRVVGHGTPMYRLAFANCPIPQTGGVLSTEGERGQ